MKNRSSLKVSLKTLYKQDETTEYRKYNRKYFTNNRYNREKKLCCLAKNLRVGDESPMLFYKIPLFAGDLLPLCKVFMTRPVLVTMIKT